ncbi:MAG: DegT/DnrJ/EryC1/StrS family aminotransferase [Actinomycetota bacterium]
MTDQPPIAFLDLAASHAPIRGRLDAAWSATVDRNGFVGGPEVAAFEEEFANYVGAPLCVGVSNGTDALELILDGLGIGPGDEVIVPANTFIATAEAVVRAGATPVFVDVDPTTALITGDHVRAALTPRTAAVMAVHLYGQMVDMTDLASVTDPAGVAIIEDAAQAHGATWDGRPAGSFGVAAGFSFYPGKNLGAFGDGGAVTTADSALAERIRSVANHGRSASSRYEHDHLGRNARMDGLQAAILRIKLAELDGWNKARREVASLYDARLDQRYRPFAEAAAAASVYHLYVVRCLDDERDVVTAVLDRHRIGWGVHYPVPCHRQTPFLTADGPAMLPVVDAQADQLLSLPMHPHLTIEEIDRVCGVLDELDRR